MINDIELEKENSEEENNGLKQTKQTIPFNELRHLETIEGLKLMDKQSSWRMKDRVLLLLALN
jgi:hypothetical protein